MWCRYPKAKSSCQCLDTIWKKPAHTKRGTCKYTRPTAVVKFALEIQVKRRKLRRTKSWDKSNSLRSMGTGLPQRPEKGVSSECGQVTESPCSPHHLDTQGQRKNRKMCHICTLVSIGGCDLLFQHTGTHILLYYHPFYILYLFSIYHCVP